MLQAVKQKFRLSWRAYTAFLLLVAAVYVSIVGQSQNLTTEAWIVLIVLGILFTLLGTYGIALCEIRQSLPLSLAYFAAQLLIAWLIIRVAGGMGLAWLLTMVLASHAMTLLPIGWAVVVAVAIVVVPVLDPLLAGANLPYLLNIVPSMVAGVFFVAVFTHIAISEERARHEVERLAAELREANRKLREYAVQAEQLATTKERNRLAREIHDGLGHYLTAINMQIKAAQAVREQDPAQASDALNKAQRLAQDALADVRRSVSALRTSPTEERPLTETIRSLTEEGRASGLNLTFVVEGTPQPLPAQAELTLYRAVQEGLTNVRKHAAAQEAGVVLRYGEQSASVLVWDDGEGAVEAEGGFGLLGLRERVHLLGGEVEVRTAPGEGFQLEVEVPV
jgi:signal transduction histidine kinase